jgi:hypothetical protein
MILGGHGEVAAALDDGVAARRLIRAWRRDPPGPCPRAGDDEHALFGRVVQPLELRPAGGASTSRREDQPARAAVHRRFDEVAWSSLVSHDDVHAWQLLDGADVELASRGMPLGDLPEKHDPIVVSDAELSVIAAPERLQTQGIGLGHVTGRTDLVVEHDQRALVAGGRIGSDAHGVHQVGGPLVTDRTRVAHRPDHHDGPDVFHSEMQEEGGFFERIRATGHDDAGERGVLGEELVDPA